MGDDRMDDGVRWPLRLSRLGQSAPRGLTDSQTLSLMPIIVHLLMDHFDIDKLTIKETQVYSLFLSN